VGWFSNRRKRESPLPPSEQAGEALGSFANPDDQPVVGQQLGGAPGVEGAAGTAEGLAALAALGPMIQQAMAEGNVQIEQGASQTVNLRGTGLREEILEIMQGHGIDAGAGTAAQNVDASAYGDMQQQILAALAKHGIDPGASGSAINLQIQPGDEK
jgi:hypothetical protein